MLKESTLNGLKSMLEQAKINAKENTDEEALNTKSLYPDWEKDFKDGDTLEVGIRVNYNEVLYKVLQTHQKQETWNPKDAVSLFTEVLIESNEVIYEWVQPESTNPYMKGDKVINNEVIYESLVDNNTWEPGVIGSETLWKEIN